MLPVFPNWYPFNDMAFDGHLQIKGCAVKTRSWDLKYRGPVLFYTSGRVAHKAVEAYGYERHYSNHKVIIWVANLVDVRKLTNEEAMEMVCNFNNIPPSELRRQLVQNGYVEEPDSAFWVSSLGYIAPCEFGFFFQDLKRFAAPVSFNWPPGPVKPIFTEVRKSKKLLEQLSLTEHLKATYK